MIFYFSKNKLKNEVEQHLIILDIKGHAITYEICMQTLGELEKASEHSILMVLQ